MGIGFSEDFLGEGITRRFPWTKGKVENQNNHLTRSIRCYLSESGNTWVIGVICYVSLFFAITRQRIQPRG